MRYKGIAGALVLLTLLLPISAVAETIFWLDTPADGATVFGLVEVNGFVVDNGDQCGPQWTWHSCQWDEALVSKIDLYVDDEFVATADMNQPRYDILQAYPWYAGTPYARPGFTTSFDSEGYSDGVHTLFMRVTFSDSSIEDYGLRSVTIDNDLNQAPLGEIELPGSLQPMNGVFPVTGWALDDEEIAYVEIMVDGLAMGNAVTGVHRPDIGNRFPSDPDAEFSGFVRMLNTTALNNGIHVLAVRVVDNEGASRVIGRRFVQTFNTGSNLPPFGKIDWPIENHVMYADGCESAVDGTLPPWSGDVFDDPDNAEMIVGWALDVGSRIDIGGVAYVQLLLDGNHHLRHQRRQLLLGSCGMGLQLLRPPAHGHPQSLRRCSELQTQRFFVPDRHQLPDPRAWLHPGSAPVQGAGGRPREQRHRHRPIAGDIRLQRRRG